ncbi:MAG TPA: type II secretion system protein [Tepidisphaeraceae bacterium]|nr:type II secretion system protein [Tepidisphaeraceae bacterium]
MKRQRRKAFTLIEILIVIGVIAILAAMLLLGTSSLMSGSKARSTKATLASLQSMFADFDARTHLQKYPPFWRWLETGQTVPKTVSPAPNLQRNKNVDFWNVPELIGDSSGAFDTMDAPGMVIGDASNAVRNGSRAVLNTQQVMILLLSVPSNTAALQKIPADRYFTPSWVAATIQGPGLHGVLYDNTSAGQAEPVHYLVGAKVINNGQKFSKKAPEADSSTGAPAPAQGGDSIWAADSSPAAPLLLDAWDNPIIFVPATGLRVRLSNGATDYNVPTSAAVQPTSMIIVSPEGQVAMNTTVTPPQPQLTRPGRPFWASAGPDGDFAKGDDNIYSFEP